MTSLVEANSTGFAPLLAALRAEVEAARGLRTAMKFKQDALIACRLDGLQALAEAVLAANQALSEAEASALGEIALLQEQGALPTHPPAEHFTASLLLSSAPTEDRAELGRAIAELGAELALVSELNLQNDALLRNLLGYTRMAVRLLAGLDGADTYTRYGGVESSAARKLVDSRV